MAVETFIWFGGEYDMTEQQIRADERAKVVKEILSAIESEYDLNYGEILINPSGFYDLVEDYLHSDEYEKG